MTSGKRLARAEAAFRLGKMKKHKDGHNAQETEDCTRWLISLPRTRREQAIDVFLGDGEARDICVAILARAAQIQRDNLSLVGKDHNWPQSIKHGGLHVAAYMTALAKNAATPSGSEAERIRDDIAHCLGTAAVLVSGGKMTIPALGLTEREMGRLWETTASLWNDQHPVILLAPIRQMAEARRALVNMGGIDVSTTTNLHPNMIQALLSLGADTGTDTSDGAQQNQKPVKTSPGKYRAGRL